MGYNTYDELLATEEARAKAHAAFDRIWTEGHMTRIQAYEWLGGHFDRPAGKCHLAHMKTRELRKVRRLAAAYLRHTSEKNMGLSS